MSTRYHLSPAQTYLLRVALVKERQALRHTRNHLRTWFYAGRQERRTVAVLGRLGLVMAPHPSDPEYGRRSTRPHQVSATMFTRERVFWYRLTDAGILLAQALTTLHESGLVSRKFKS